MPSKDIDTVRKTLSPVPAFVKTLKMYLRDSPCYETIESEVSIAVGID